MWIGHVRFGRWRRVNRGDCAVPKPRASDQLESASGQAMKSEASGNGPFSRGLLFLGFGLRRAINDPFAVSELASIQCR
jgi:hypothetical protein